MGGEYKYGKRIVAFIATFILFTQFTLVSQVNDTAINKMRTFRIRNKVVIGLQAPIDKLKEITVKSKVGHYYLKKGAFGGTDSIDIQVNKNNQIVNVSFFYDTVSTYSYEVDLFNKHLNLVGKETQLTEGKKKIKTTKWEDKFTVFEMIEIRECNKWKLHSVITDKGLNLKK